MLIERLSHLQYEDRSRNRRVILVSRSGTVQHCGSVIVWVSIKDGWLACKGDICLATDNWREDV